ncbi:uncharacterized protein CELE_F57G8.7 [Caenorhabditis elegans]|uniref:Conserved domain protein n=1 Tax=Caenorhabditis elegans TaxID=6239 RepID=Q9XU92_CAEEL|nr:uncharacterized protein CELE_F57G8.7 [Caenorhabditis elegans]CAB05531.2 Conserved domain protein [Caenorhabditis elegans]|eukprot:NP_507127.2 Uncharacterized protein CELE_F57G8.7 [Caenorhabditis elegans]
MKTIILFLALTSFAYAGSLGLAIPAGAKDVHLPITIGDIKAITRKLKNGSVETWNVVGPNKGTWVDSKGKKIDSSNYSYKAGTIVIKKVSKNDEGFYDYEPLTTFAPEKLPPGVHVDPVQRGLDLTVISSV